MRKSFILAASIALAFAASPASAVTFVLNMDQSVDADARRGVDVAAAYWSSVLTDDVTVTVDISVGSAFGGYGVTSNTVDFLGWGNARALLASDSSSSLDAAAVAEAGLHPEFDGRTLQSSTAVLKALGVSEGTGGNTLADGIDAVTEFSNRPVFDYDPSDGISAGLVDFVGVALHELGHALGFSPNISRGFNTSTTTLDLFRYNSPGNLDFTAFGPGTYFSIDDGAHQLFGASEFGGGHWKAAPVADELGVMTEGGSVHFVSALDLAAFDAMGWDLGFDVLSNSAYRDSTADIFRRFSAAAVPEPSSWMMMIAGFVLIGGAVRRNAAGKRHVAYA